MKKYNYFIGIMLSLILLPCTIYADCTQEEIEHFKEIEDQYKVTYEFNKESKDYTLKFYSPEPNAYDFNIYIDYEIDCKYFSEKEYECYHIHSGEVEVGIFSENKSCEKSFRDTKFQLTKYNTYSEDKLCEGIEEFVLCQPTYDKEITYDTFVERVNIYKKTKSKKEKVENKNQDTNSKVIDFIDNNITEIIIITIFIAVVVVAIILIAKSAKKSRRLE